MNFTGKTGLPSVVTATDSLLSIAMLCDSFGALGGVAQIVEDLAAEFAIAGHRVAVVSNPHKGKTITRPQNPGVEQVWVDLPRAKPLSLRHPERLWRQRAAPHLTDFICRWSPDVINIHGGLRDRFPAVLKACRGAQVPVVQSFHLVPAPSQEGREGARLRNFTCAALRAATAITFPSFAVKHGFKEISPEAERAKIIRGGVNLGRAARAIPIERQRPYIFSASRLDLHHKAVDVLIAAFGSIALEFPEIDLLIAGDGPQRLQIEKAIADSKLEGRIHLLSSLPHEQLWSLYKGARVFVMLSRLAEGLPLVFFEAMACSTPVIGTRTGGTPEVVIHEETGLLVDSNEPSRVATAIKTLLTDDAAREEMGRRGLELVKKFDWQVVAASYIELYQNLLRCSSHPRRV